MSTKMGLDEVWGIMEEGIVKAKRILEGYTDTSFSPDEYLKYYSCVYQLAVQNSDYSAALYERYNWTLQQCVTSVVLPSLMDKNQEVLLQVLVQMWSNYNLMCKFLSSFFSYLDRFYTCRRKVAPLSSVAHSTFCNLVLPKYVDRIIDAVVALINHEREGELINRDLVRSVMVFIIDAGMESMYEKSRQGIIENMYAYYCQKASKWVLDYSLVDYSLKVGECLKNEADRLENYFVFDGDDSKRTLLQAVEQRLVSMYRNQLRTQQLDHHLAFENHQVISQELLPMCAGLTLEEKK